MIRLQTLICVGEYVSLKKWVHWVFGRCEPPALSSFLPCFFLFPLTQTPLSIIILFFFSLLRSLTLQTTSILFHFTLFHASLCLTDALPLPPSSLIFLVHPLPPGCHGGAYQRKLYRDLMVNYNRLERPVQNDSAPIVVELGLTLLQIIDVVSVWACLCLGNVQRQRKTQRESYAERSLSNFRHLGLFPGFFCFVLFMFKLLRLLYLQRLRRILIHLLELAALYLPLKTVTPTSGAQSPTKWEYSPLKERVLCFTPSILFHLVALRALSFRSFIQREDSVSVLRCAPSHLFPSHSPSPLHIIFFPPFWSQFRSLCVIFKVIV